MLALQLDAEHHDDVGIANGLADIVGEIDAGSEVLQFPGQERGGTA